MSDDALTLKEAAQHFGVSVQTIRRWIKDGKLEAELRDSPYGQQYYIPSYQIKTASEIQDVVRVDHTVDMASLARVMDRFLSEREQALFRALESIQTEFKQSIQRYEQIQQTLRQEVAETREENQRLHKQLEEMIAERNKQLQELTEKVEQRDQQLLKDVRQEIAVTRENDERREEERAKKLDEVLSMLREQREQEQQKKKRRWWQRGE